MKGVKRKCIFLSPDEKTCKQIKTKTCVLCKFYRIEGETDQEYRERKYLEKKKAEEKRNES